MSSKIETVQRATHLHSLQVHNLDLRKRKDEKRWLCQLNKAVGGWLNPDARARRHTIEAKLAKGNINLDVLVPSSVGNLLCKALEFLVKHCSPSSFLLFGLEFFLVAIPVFSLPRTSLVELHLRGLAVELHVLCLFLPNQDGIDQVNVNDDDQFMSGGLKEQVLNIAEENVNLVLVIRARSADGMQVSKTILVNLNVTY